MRPGRAQSSLTTRGIQDLRVFLLRKSSLIARPAGDRVHRPSSTKHSQFSASRPASAARRLALVSPWLVSDLVW